MGRTPLSVALLFLGACAVATAGWSLFWFLTDDAFITFRYASNWMQGYGFTWNPPPFRPVEGYSNFLWLILLTGTWWAFGVEPPDAANPLALGFGFVSLALTTALLWRRLARCEAPWRTVLLAVALLALVTQPTFLTWLSSGLETSLWNALVLWWVLEALRVPERANALPRLCAAAALLALTRPDGLGFWIATGVMAAASALPGVAAERAGAWSQRFRPRAAAAAWLLLPILHLLWRHARYGEWLPNTYYAKVIAPWPSMGLRYLASFAIEHGLIVWLGVATLAGVTALRRGAFARLIADWHPRVVPALMVATLLAQVAFYVLLVGGDHFEYRVFSHILPLLLVFLVAALGVARVRPRGQLAVLLLFWLSALPIPWLHWWKTRDIDNRLATYALHHAMRVPLAESFPWPLRPLVSVWDELQHELIGHSVCSRRKEHAVFYRYQVAKNPSRDEGASLPWSERHLLLAGTVGVPGWVLPHVAILDSLGLNDRVVARAPLAVSDEDRQMAHDRKPPPEYVRCLAPDLFYVKSSRAMLRVSLPPDVAPGTIQSLVRSVEREPLSDARIQACESQDWY